MDRFIAATRAVERDHWWFQSLRRFAVTMCRSAGVPSAGRALDCGCGTGGNEPFLATFGTTFGIDRTRSALDFCRADGWLRIAQANAGRLPFPDATFDLVTSFDVLYCLSDDEERQALGEMRRVLRPGGHVLLNVCAFPALRGAHSAAVHERRRYTRRMLADRLAAASLSVVRMSYLYASAFVPLVLARSIERLAGIAAPGEAPTDFNRTPPLLSALLEAAFRAEASVLRHAPLPFGSSLMCVAKTATES